MVDELGAVQKTVIAKRPRSLRGILVCLGMVPHIIVKGIILGIILYLTVATSLFANLTPLDPRLNYAIVGILGEVAALFVMVVLYRDVGKLPYTAISMPKTHGKPLTLNLQQVISGVKKWLSILMAYLQRRWKLVLIFAFADVINVVWTIFIQLSPTLVFYYFMIGTVILALLLYAVENSRYSIALGASLKSYIPSKVEIVGFVVIVLVLSTPIYFNKDTVMPNIVSNYERAGYFDRFLPLFAGQNDTMKVQTIMHESTTCFSDMYSGMFNPTFNPMIMGTVIPPAITLRPDSENMILASKYMLISQNGNCAESSFLSIGLAQVAGIPVRQVGFHGEDHAFTEMFVNGSWITVDPLSGYGDGYNVPPRFYEGSWGYKVSYAEAVYPNGTVEDVTSRYTDTGRFNVTVMDQNGDPVSNASVTVNSYNRADLPAYRLPMPTGLVKTTGQDGKVELVIGDGQYQITASNDTLQGSLDRVLLNVSEVKPINITLQQKRPDMVTESIMQNMDLVKVVIIFGDIIIAFALMLLLKIYNNRYLKVAVYGFYAIFLIGILLTLARMVIVY